MIRNNLKKLEMCVKICMNTRDCNTEGNFCAKLMYPKYVSIGPWRTKRLLAPPFPSLHGEGNGGGLGSPLREGIPDPLESQPRTPFSAQSPPSHQAIFLSPVGESDRHPKIGVKKISSHFQLFPLSVRPKGAMEYPSMGRGHRPQKEACVTSEKNPKT